MAEKIIPDLQEIYDVLRNENSQDFPHQRVAMVNRVLNAPVNVLPEIHLEEWYNQFWRLAGISAQINRLSDEEQNLCAQLFNVAKNQDAPKKQFFALALILFGKINETESLIEKKIWSKHLRDDYETFKNWRQIMISGPTLVERARISHARKIKSFLTEKYSYVIERHAKTVINNKNCPKVAPKDYQIYYCWFQGEENLPVLARCCYNSLKENAGQYKIVFLSEKNFYDYIDLPSYLIDKIRAGKVTRVHFTDILRANILERYGGLWLDATVLVTEPLENYKKLLRLPFFTQKYTHEKSNDHPIAKRFGAYSSYGRWGGFIQGTSVLHNPFHAFAKDFYNEYWKDFDELIDYVLIDFMTDIAYDNIPAFKKELDDVPINNTEVWTLSPYLNTPYEGFPYDKILKGNFLNKFSSRKQLDLNAEGTVLKAIQKRYAPETLSIRNAQ